MGKGGSKSQTVTQVQEIPPFLQNQLQQVFGAAQDIQPAVFAGERVAGFSPTELQAQQLTAERALAGDSTVQQAQGLLGGIISGGSQPTYAESFLGDIARGQSPTNPFLQTQIDNAISGAVNQAASQYALGGRLGSGAFGSALGAGVTSAAAPILAQQVEADRAAQMQAAGQLISAEQQNRARQMQAAGLAPQLANQRFADLTALEAVGGQQRQLSQAQIQAQQDFINELNAAQMSKFGALASAAGLTPSAMNTSATQPGVSPLASAAGGGLTGYAAGSALAGTGLGTALGITGPIGALVGAGLGLLG